MANQERGAVEGRLSGYSSRKKRASSLSVRTPCAGARAWPRCAGDGAAHGGGHQDPRQVAQADVTPDQAVDSKEPKDAQPQDDRPRFKRGDFMRTPDGRVGRLRTQLRQAFCWYARLEFCHDRIHDGTRAIKTKDTWLTEVLEPVNNLKVGDRVKVRKVDCIVHSGASAEVALNFTRHSATQHEGKKGVVTVVDDNDNTVAVRFACSIGVGCWFPHTFLTRLGEKEQTVSIQNVNIVNSPPGEYKITAKEMKSLYDPIRDHSMATAAAERADWLAEGFGGKRAEREECRCASLRVVTVGPEAGRAKCRECGQMWADMDSNQIRWCSTGSNEILVRGPDDRTTIMEHVGGPPSWASMSKAGRERLMPSRKELFIDDMVESDKQLYVWRDILVRKTFWRLKKVEARPKATAW